MALVPTSGGDGGAREDLARACHFCAAPSAGPCAWCRLPICAADPCAVVVREPGLAPVVLCRDCASSRPLAASRPWLPGALALAGLGLVACAALLGQALAAGIAWIAGAALILAAGAALLSRRQWRARLGSARGEKERRA